MIFPLRISGDVNPARKVSWQLCSIGLDYQVVGQLTNESAYAYLNIQFQYFTFRPDRLFCHHSHWKQDEKEKEHCFRNGHRTGNELVVSLKCLIALTSGSLL